MEENESASSVIGSGSAWVYLNSLATQYAQATNYYANFHPSIDNYFMITTGDNPANDNDSFTSTVSVDNIVRHMMVAGKTWKSYAQSLPSVGYTGGDVADSQGMYYIRHNPFAYFSDVRNSTNEAANLVPFTQFATDLAANNLPNLTYIVPDGNYDAHDGTPAQADGFLKTNLAPLLASPAFQPGGDGLLIIAFDEAATSDTTHGGGRIVVVMVGPNVKRGYQSTVLYQHQNLGRTIFEALGLSSQGFPGLIATAADMSDFFTTGAPTASGAPAAAPAAPAAAGDFQLTAAPASGLNYQVSITPENGFASPVTLSCSGLPAGVSCSFSPSVLTPGTTTSALTVSMNTTASALTPAQKAKPLYALTLPFFAIAMGSAAVGGGRKKKLAFLMILVLVVALGAVTVGCGGGSGSTKSTPASSTSAQVPAATSGMMPAPVTANIVATSGAIQHSISVTLQN